MTGNKGHRIKILAKIVICFSTRCHLHWKVYARSSNTYFGLTCYLFFKKMSQTRPLFLFIFVLFSHHMDKYSTNLAINEKSVDGMLGS